MKTSSTPASWFTFGTRHGSTPAATLPSSPRFIHAMSLMTQPSFSAAATYYVRVEGIAPAVAEAIYGKGHVVDEHFDGCAYFVDSADGKALAEAARKVEAVGGSVKLVLRRLPEEV